VTDRDWTGELESYLQDRLAELCDSIGQRVPLPGLRISPPLATEEAKYFVLGFESGLFRLDRESYVQSDLFPAPNEEDLRQRMCQIFWCDSLPPRLFREGICQLSTASLLILQRGWLRSQVRLEPSIDEQPSITGGADILVKSSTGMSLIAVEVKRNAAEVHKLVTDLQACCRRGAHAHGDCGFPQNHPKYEFCATYKPTYFWAVAPDAEICFRMNYEAESIAPEQLTSLPPRSMIELEAG